MPASAKLPSFCLSGVATRIRIRPPAAAAAAATAAAAAAAAAEAGVGKKPDSCQPPTLACGDDEVKKDQNADDGCGDEEAEKEDARVVMVAVDRSPDAKTALLWALSHAVQSHDSLLLLDVVKPPKSTEKQCEKERGPKDYQLLYAMKSICQTRRPEWKGGIAGHHRGGSGAAARVAACRGGPAAAIAGTDVASPRDVGPRRDFGGCGSGNARIGSPSPTTASTTRLHALAVRRKGRRGGGYLLTTKRHKDFWLLA
uniref:UspA domain-containing protein n=1 Tax=Ananas comosus var. bracteatus TaxID=296719 RepID=A0A6V7NVF2_ANACO|nr:unnamed protein product [Ananas comosus var. bracteatus]